ncbi:uncharacterized protein CDAR_466541 [Caerostris darwini]|uniref:Ribosomal protein S14 n=1 Tax=Caerostris darwini TaxID=1538125 RepID=A0AAV4PQ54_9ARAC|nr:uncharacterized protein CDAR_466541 [Caerostris darwini]
MIYTKLIANSWLKSDTNRSRIFNSSGIYRPRWERKSLQLLVMLKEWRRVTRPLTGGRIIKAYIRQSNFWGKGNILRRAGIPCPPAYTYAASSVAKPVPRPFLDSPLHSLVACRNPYFTDIQYPNVTQLTLKIPHLIHKAIATMKRFIPTHVYHDVRIPVAVTSQIAYLVDRKKGSAKTVSHRYTRVKYERLAVTFIGTHRGCNEAQYHISRKGGMGLYV